MKRLLIATALIFSLAFRPVPAEALIIDAPTLAAKISEWAGKLARCLNADNDACFSGKTDDIAGLQ